MKKSLAFFWLSLALVAAACAQDRPAPFGFKAGWSHDEVITAVGKSHVKTDRGSTVGFDASPGASNGFDFFMVAISKKGLAKLVASADVPTNRSGEQIREKYEAVKSALVAKYGKPKGDFDFLHSGALFAEPEDFTMSLLKEERTLSCTWERSDGTLISLRASGASSQEARLYLSYEFHPEFDLYSADREKQEQNSY